MKCPLCDSLTILRTRTIKYTRDGRTVEASSHCWECPNAHVELAGRTHQFQDEMLSRQNEELAEAAWQAAYGEPLPLSRYDLKNKRK